MSDENNNIILYRTPGEECPYLPGRIWRTDFFQSGSLPGDVYEILLGHNFRRGGDAFYQNVCRGCAECVQLRIPVAAFTPSRSQKRVVRKNRDISLSLVPVEFREDVCDLYLRYSVFKHDKNEDEETFRSFLCVSPLDTRMSLYHAGDTLVAAGWLDVLPGGLSSVYFAFEPEFARRSLGVFSVIKEIELAKTMGLDYYYLGFYVANSPKMEYKAAFRPQQRLIEGKWLEF
ncbi:MAG: arginyltransferase [Spirochaetales bacterium]|jgi:arginine-tRNA-protein transferase|nr:arginyltransferase [Spirochaetales bacterium]